MSRSKLRTTENFDLFLADCAARYPAIDLAKLLAMMTEVATVEDRLDVIVRNAAHLVFEDPEYSKFAAALLAYRIQLSVQNLKIKKLSRLHKRRCKTWPLHAAITQACKTFQKTNRKPFAA